MKKPRKEIKHLPAGNPYTTNRAVLSLDGRSTEPDRKKKASREKCREPIKEDEE
jgi:hypothetical protein